TSGRGGGPPPPPQQPQRSDVPFPFGHLRSTNVSVHGTPRMTRWAREPDSIVSHRCDEGVKATEQTRDGDEARYPADEILGDGRAMVGCCLTPTIRSFSRCRSM